MDEKSWQITSSLLASSGGLAHSEFPGSTVSIPRADPVLPTASPGQISSYPAWISPGLCSAQSSDGQEAEIT